MKITEEGKNIRFQLKMSETGSNKSGKTLFNFIIPNDLTLVKSLRENIMKEFDIFIYKKSVFETTHKAINED
jgi:hypothetical protein